MLILSFIFYRILQNSCNSEAMLSNRWSEKWNDRCQKHVGYFGMIHLSWLNQPSTLPLLFSISAQIKKMKKKQVSEVWIEWRVRYDGSSCGVMEMYYFGWYGELLFIPADWIRGREILIKWAISFFSSHITLSLHFLFFSSEKRHYGFLDSFN